MLLLRQAQQARPEQRAASEIEGMQQLVAEPVAVPAISFSGFGNFAQIVEYQLARSNCGAMTCTYRPSTTANVVRRISWRRTISLMLRSRTASVDTPMSAGAHRGH